MLHVLHIDGDLRLAAERGSGVNASDILAQIIDDVFAHELNKRRSRSFEIVA